MTNELKALIFDCDGVLAETERDGHRVAFNRAFAVKGYDLEWDAALYKELVRIGGGKERMKHFFDRTSWPAGTSDKDALIKELAPAQDGLLHADHRIGGIAPAPGRGPARRRGHRGGHQAGRLLDLEREVRPYRRRTLARPRHGKRNST